MSLMTKVGVRFVAENKAARGFSSFNRTLSKTSRQLLAIAGVGGGLYAVQRGFREAVKAASDLQETQAKFNTVFKSFSAEANKWAVNFGKNVGRSEQSVKSWLARLQDTFVPLGIARDEAMGLSKELVTLAVDVASFNNAADANVIRDFTSALVGNHETVRKYGVIIGESAIKQEALRKGLNKTYAQLTDLEKVQLRYSLIQRGTTDAQGDALRTADSYANQLKRLKANVSDLAVEIGEPLMDALNSLFTELNKNSEAISLMFTRPIKALDELIKIIKVLPDLVDKKTEGTRLQRGGMYWAYPDYNPRNKKNVPGGLSEGELLLEKRERDIATMIRADRSRWQTLVLSSSYQWLKEPTTPAAISAKPLTAQQKKATEVRSKFLPLIEKEIALTGKVGEAHWHAAKMIEFEEKIRASGLEGTAEAIDLRKEMVDVIERLAEAQKLARIADDIGDSFAMAFETIVFEGGKARDVINALIKDISRSVLRNLVTQPLAAGISAGIGGLFGIVPTAQHGGEVAKTGLAVIHKGEKFSGVDGGGFGLPSIVFEYKGLPMEQKGEPVWDGDKLIFQLEAKLADRLGRGAGPLPAAVKSVR